MNVLDRYLPKQEPPVSFQVSGIPASFKSVLDRFERIKDKLERTRVDAFVACMAAGVDAIEPAVEAFVDAKDSEAAG